MLHFRGICMRIGCLHIHSLTVLKPQMKQSESAWHQKLHCQISNKTNHPKTNLTRETTKKTAASVCFTMFYHLSGMPALLSA